MVIKPKVRGFVCVTAHPAGCAAHVQEQINYVRARGPLPKGPKKVLVIGASTGYGLASRISAAFGSGAATIGVFFERPSEADKQATPGWYNTAAFTAAAKQAGLYVKNFNGDAFSDQLKTDVLAAIKADLGQVDLVVYSLASPRRTHPNTGVTHKSVLKPVGQTYSNKTVDTDKGIVSQVTIEPANEAEIADTTAVMGGEDWEMWINALDEAKLLAPGATSVAYSYIGPELTWPIYKNGTIGLAKNDLERAAKAIDATLKVNGYGRAFISVNKALVTQASSAIPVVPLYISMLYKIMKAKGTHEGCIEQIDRLFRDQMYGGTGLQFDSAGRVRIDDWEMRPEIQAEVAAIWPQVTTENLAQLTDIAGYREEFLKLFGFGIAGIDYDADIDPHVDLGA
ncbi:MAG: trans-2-enoyl-CoA reductase family protein [Opitutaceae bacterium]|jgi:enoyl-[acyl-carrier protein] reductase/trans-2-enoyl-CoA reductase (NAD+)|nr:trans-2-enoyl-CoA reductase family protein [Opitutaceae bacterium]